MAHNRRLNEYIGKAVMLFEPDAYATDASLAASDNTNTIRIEGYDGVLFGIEMGEPITGTTLAVAIQYSSTGSASDAVASNATMTCSDAITGTLSSTGEDELYLIDFNIGAKGLNTAAGILCAAVTADGCDFAVWAIPYGGNKRFPISQENTVVVANAAV